jgi:hypothetical protein
MKGIDQTVDSFFRNSARELFIGVVEAITKNIEKKDSKLASELTIIGKPATEKLLSALFDQWTKKITDHWAPVLNIASTLPKDELAAMAEALVNLTKFRRRVTPTRETVGGPVDVAIITKGDGFVWIKRKHYFSAELNPRVLSKLQRE